MPFLSRTAAFERGVGEIGDLDGPVFARRGLECARTNHLTCILIDDKVAAPLQLVHADRNRNQSSPNPFVYPLSDSRPIVVSERVHELLVAGERLLDGWLQPYQLNVAHRTIFRGRTTLGVARRVFLQRMRANLTPCPARTAKTGEMIASGCAHDPPIGWAANGVGAGPLDLTEVHMSAKHKARICEFLDRVLTGGDIEATGDYFERDMVEEVPFPGQGPGLDGLKETLIRIRSAFPDSNWTVEEQIAEGDKVVSRFVWSGTHQGEFLGIPATHRPIRVWGMVIDRFAGEKIVSTRILMDTFGMMMQLGVISNSAQQAR